MKFNIISYTLFLFVMVIFFPTLIFAPWTLNDPPKTAPSDVKKTCPEWIEFSKFTLNDYDENRRLTKFRDVTLDKDASKYAAMYAIKIGGKSTPPKLLPHKFCEDIGDLIYTHSFLTLKDQLRTCPSWISSYGYLEHDAQYNITYAFNQVPGEMNEISIWAYSYYKYSTTWGAGLPMIPLEFCDKLAINVSKYTNFINTQGPHQTCKVWIELYGYTDDVYSNWIKAARLLESAIYSQILVHDFPKDYARRILLKRVDVFNRIMTPLEYCRKFLKTSDQVDDTTTYSFDYTFSSFPEMRA